MGRKKKDKTVFKVTAEDLRQFAKDVVREAHEETIKENLKKRLFLTCSQAAKELDISHVYMRKLCEWGTIKAVKTSTNGHWRISLYDLEQYKNNR